MSQDGHPTAPQGTNTYVPAEQEHVDLFRLLDELEELPERARRLPFNVLAGFNSEHFYYLVLKIRANLPEDLKKAQRVAIDSERIVDAARSSAMQQVDAGRVEADTIVEQARTEGNRVIESARQQAARMVDASEVNRMAGEQAKDILQRAETEAAEMRKGAEDYARDILSRLETYMSKAIVTVQNGREALDKHRSG